MASSPEYELLCGIVAQQLGCVTETDVIRAFAQWRQDKSIPLVEILQRAGALDSGHREAIEQAIKRQLDLHDGNAQRSLAALRPSPSLCDAITGFDEDLDSIVSWLTSVHSKHDLDDRGDERLTVDRDNAVSDLSESDRYEITREHARGGLGKVFVARDKQLEREVALKQILPAFSSDSGCRHRFLLEAQITGSLEHPGIVPVYGLGVQPDGHLFYAMRFIRGESLGTALKQFHRDRPDYHLALRKLLRRLVGVCDAMHYAHSRGILHRDIKPDNIMLGPYGETLVVDWGLARLMEKPGDQSDRLANERTLHPTSDNQSISTRWGTLVGTPAYMSPEQALGWHDALTPASDVYSLGATLYTVLTGLPAFADPSLEQLILRVQQGKFTRPRAIQRSVPKSLESICLKAMATSPNDRYRSARELAEDLEKFLADEPVSALRESWWTRVGRWTRRHRGAAGALMAALIALLVGLVILAVILSLAGQKERGLRLIAEQESQRADANFELAHGAIDRYLTEVTEDPLLKQHGFEHLRRQLLKNARDFYERLLVRRAGDSSLAVEQAWTHFRLGSIEQEIGTVADAQDHYVKARESFQHLLDQQSTDRAAREGLAMACINLANLYYAQGQTETAQQQLARARELTAALLEDRSVPTLERQLASCFNNEASWALARDDRDAALTNYQLALEIRTRLYQQHPDNISNTVELVALYGNLTILHRRFGETQKAQAAAQRAVTIGQQTLVSLTDRPYALQGYAVAQMRLADLHAETNQHGQALDAYNSASDLLTRLVNRHPNIHLFRKSLASCENNLGNLLRSMNQLNSAGTKFRHAVDLCEQLVQFDPRDIQYADLLGSCLLNEASIELEMSKLDKAGPLIERAMAIYNRLLKRQQSAPEEIARFARVLVLQGQLLENGGQIQPATESYNQAIDVLRTLSDENPNVPSYRSYLAAALERLGNLSIRSGNSKQAESYLQEAIQLRRAIAKQVSDARTAVELAAAQVQLSRVLTDRGKIEKAGPLLDEAIGSMQRLASGSSSNADAEQRLAAALLQRGLVRMRQEQFEPALTDFERLATMSIERDRVGVLCQKAICLARLGQHAKAAQQITEIQNELGKDVFALYDSAVVYSLCVDVVKRNSSLSVEARDALEQRYVTAAIILLERLRDTGHLTKPINKKMLLEDPQFAPLRDSEPYQDFLKSLPDAGSARTPK